MKYDFFSMGNILTDILISVEDRDLKALNIHKGTMKIIDHKEGEKFFQYHCKAWGERCFDKGTGRRDNSCSGKRLHNMCGYYWCWRHLCSRIPLWH